jgi:2-amino-4-hydroxy-6-hydroxymethyldihydropteridine diphosphokinase
LGSNVGDRGRNLRAAIEHLAQILQIEAVSSIYETDPVGYADQPRFWNLVLRGQTELSPANLLHKLIDIEKRMGRERTFRNAPRIIDIDILLFGDAVLNEPGLELPHPRMTERAFVLAPLTEIAPDLADPLTGRLYRDMLREGKFENVDRVGDLES